MKLAHISAVCNSKENAARFYKDILGLKEIKEFSIDEKLTESIFGVICSCQIILYGNDDFTIEIFIPEAEPFNHNPFSHQCIEVANKGEFIKQCQAAGLQPELIPKGDKALLFVKDFDGNLYEVKELDS